MGLNGAGEGRCSHFASEADLRTVLSALGDAIEKSEVFQGESRNRFFTAVVVLSDPAGRLSFVLDNGRVRAGTGRLTAPPMLVFSLGADQFDAVLSGRLHPLQLALSGRAKISGNLLHALPLHELLPETTRLYREIRGRR